MGFLEGLKDGFMKNIGHNPSKVVKTPKGLNNILNEEIRGNNMSNIENIYVNVTTSLEGLKPDSISLINELLKKEEEKTASIERNNKILKAQKHFAEAIKCDVNTVKSVKSFPEFFYIHESNVWKINKRTSDGDELIIFINDNGTIGEDLAKTVVKHTVDSLNNGQLNIKES